MRRFIGRFLKLVALPALLFLVGYECSIRSVPNSYKLKHDYLSAKGDSIELLILGSSHGFYGINPSCFSSLAFNAANVSQPLDYDWNILKSYPLPNLKVVILPILTSSFWGDLHLGIESYRCRKYAIYMPNLELNETISNRFEFFNPSLSPLISHLKGRDRVQTSASGFGLAYSFEKRVEDLYLSGQIAAERHNVVDFNLGLKSKIDAFEHICEYCEVHNISLYVLRMPAIQTYKDGLGEHLKFKYDSIMHRYQSIYNFEYKDFWQSQDFIDDDFYDGDHLNNRGARKISLMLDSLVGYNKAP